MAIFNYDCDEDPYDDDERFYRETVYNEDYYIVQEKELIRQSNLDLEHEKLEDENIRELREGGLLEESIMPQPRKESFERRLSELESDGKKISRRATPREANSA